MSVVSLCDTFHTSGVVEYDFPLYLDLESPKILESKSSYLKNYVRKTLLKGEGRSYTYVRFQDENLHPEVKYIRWNVS